MCNSAVLVFFRYAYKCFWPTSTVFCCRDNIFVYRHAHVQMCQTNETAIAAWSEKSIAEWRASKRRKRSVENSSQCRAAEQQSSSQPTPQESHLEGCEQVIAMLQPLLPGERVQQKPVLCRGPSASGAIHTTNQRKLSKPIWMLIYAEWSVETEPNAKTWKENPLFSIAKLLLMCP